MDTRERLITSTQELLWERGYVGTSPKAIQQRAGVGQGSMYHHFSGKPDLALAAIQRCAEEIRAFAATDEVLAGSTSQVVVSTTAIDRIVSATALYGVALATAINGIVSKAAVHCVALTAA